MLLQHYTRLVGRAPGGATRRRLGGGGGDGDGYVDFDEDCGDIYDHCQAFSWDETYDVMICVSASRAACFYFSSTERDDDANYDAITAVVDTDGPNDVLGKVLSWTDGEFDGYWNAAVYGYALEDVAEGSAQDEHRDLEGGF